MIKFNEKIICCLSVRNQRKNHILEKHNLVFVVTEDKNEAEFLAKKKTKIKNGLHCNSIFAIEKVAGYTVRLIKNQELGRYLESG